MQKIQYIKASELTPHPQNPRIIKDRQFQILCESIKKHKTYFETRPILANKDLVVFAGNMRLKAALEIGLEEVPVAIMDISEEEQRDLMIRDNRQNGEWDLSLLAATYDNEELLAMGFEENELGLGDYGGGTNAELKQDDLNDVFTINLTFPHDRYLKIMDDLQKLKDESGMDTNEEVIEKLISENA
jgi:ParB-like chromosome segregation protein Spo0J